MTLVQYLVQVCQQIGRTNQCNRVQSNSTKSEQDIRNNVFLSDLSTYKVSAETGLFELIPDNYIYSVDSGTKGTTKGT